MRTGSIAFRVAGVAAVLVMAPATAAFAGSSVKATVTPAASAPGGTVEIRVVGCRDGSGTAMSEVFVADAELSAKKHDGWLAGAARVRRDVKPGTYDLRVRCDLRDHPAAGTVKIDRRAHEPHPSDPSKPDPSKPDPSHRPSEPAPSKTHRHDEPTRPGDSRPTPPPRPHESPVAPVKAGGGGTAVLAAPVSTVDAHDAGPSTSQTVIGLLLAGAAAVAAALRSARRRRRTGTD